jgi:hypothetical protein
MVRLPVGLLAAVAVATAAPSVASAQESRLARLPEAARSRVEGVLDGARAGGLPIEPLVDRALEGAARGAPPDLIVSAVLRLREELRVAREAFGMAASHAELIAGASALRAGATHSALARLRQLRPGQPLTIAAAVLADLAAAGVPTDMGIAAVLALAPGARDSDYVAFRRNVERDIALGATPAASIEARLQATRAMADLGNVTLSNTTQSGSATTPRKRKP